MLFLALGIPLAAGCAGGAVTSDKYWSRVYATKGHYTVQDAANAEDGFIITGYVSPFENRRDDDLFAAKIDSYGNMSWNKRYGTAKNERGNSIYKLHRGFIIAGMVDSGKDTGRDAWILKCDDDGDIIWNRVIGGYKDDYAQVVKPDQNNYIVLGSTASYGKAGQSIWVVLLDWNGNVLWDKTYGDASYNAGMDIVVEKDGYVIAGNTVSDRYSDVLVFKIDKKGNILWDRILGGNGTNYAETIRGWADGYIVAGSASKAPDSDRDAWLLRLDLKGNPLWSRTYGGKGDDMACSVVPTTDGFIVSGSTNSYSEDDSYHAWLFEVDGKGEIIWNRTFREAYTARRVIPVYDGYMVSGNRKPTGSGGGIWLLRTDKQGEVQKRKT